MSLGPLSIRALLPPAFAALLFISTASVAVALRAAESIPPDLSGSWTLNAEMSQSPPRGGMEDGTRPAGRIGGGMGGGGAMGRTGGGRPGGGPMGGSAGGMDPERMHRTRETMRELLEAPGHLSISTEADGTVVFESPDGSRERILADGKKRAHAVAAGEVTNRASWRDGALRVETTTKDGLKIERRFALEAAAPSGTRLVVTYIANLPMARRPMEVKKVYDRTPR